MNWCWLIPFLLLTACDQAGRKNSHERPEPAPRSGEAIFESCALCHSTKEMQRGPILNGLPAWYAELQLRKFRDGIRGANPENRSEHLMGAAAATLQSEEELARAAGHLSLLPPANHLRTVRGDAERGRLVYLRCLPCHGEQAQGNREQKGPPLNLLEDWYQLDQLRKFQNGQRGGDPRDAEGQVMRQAMAGLTDADLHNVVRYIAVELATAPLHSKTKKSAGEK